MTSNNKHIEEYKDMIKTMRPLNWQLIPDIDLYMDQVIALMEKQHIGLKVGETITPSMINNYAKQGLIPRAKGKRYGRDHIATLTAICLLKQVLTVGETKDLLDLQLNEFFPGDVQDENSQKDSNINKEIKDFYEEYTNLLDTELIKVDTLIGDKLTNEELSKMALKLAVSSYANKIACQCILKSIAKDKDGNEDAK